MEEERSWGKSFAELSAGLEPRKGMVKLFEELHRRLTSPNFTEPVAIGPGVLVLSNPEGTSMTKGSPDYFGPQEMYLFQVLCYVSNGQESSRFVKVPDDLEAFDKECEKKFQQLVSSGRLQ
ncbi:MAG: hypothetical protein HY457_00590 [Parcubacteria group bacterium]|nr:hypothetical protein [Parcubacteria group bacterium]